MHALLPTPSFGLLRVTRVLAIRKNMRSISFVYINTLLGTEELENNNSGQGECEIEFSCQPTRNKLNHSSRM